MLGRWLARTWRHKGWAAYLLWPFSLGYQAAASLHRSVYRFNILKTERCGVPVIVVGNVVAGGGGKTPLVIALAIYLQGQGLQVGVISRGYGRRRGTDKPGTPVNGFLEVLENTPVSESGDEPALILRALAAPVFVANRRIKAARALLFKYPGTQVVISDDGLQHYGLARDIEVVVFDDRGTGNGWLLPAGPLRQRWLPDQQQALVVHTGQSPAFGGFVSNRRLADNALAVDGSQVRLDDLKHLQLTALAGIASPDAFFDMLRARGLHLNSTIILPDHHDFSNYVLPVPAGATVLCTEKDAIKLFKLPDRPNIRFLAVPLIFTPEPAFLKAVDDLLLPMLSPPSLP